MELKNFPNPKLNLPKELRDSGNSVFSGVEQYIDMVHEYIYTDIDLGYCIYSYAKRPF